MGRPPAYIFVVRHGSRLDASDSSWAQSSSTPYDTPLTYGGWLQARAVGARIANILAQAEEEPVNDAPRFGPATEATHNNKAKKLRRRFKVAIHSSPFTRCVQTSAGISAGLSKPITAPVSTSSSPRMPSPSVIIPSPIVKPPASKKNADAAASAAVTQAENPVHQPHPPHHHEYHRAVLRLDEFLGEWLAPDYYEDIAHPPKSSTMAATAKAGLLRREQYSHYAGLGSKKEVAPTSHGKLWTSSSNSNSSSGSNTPVVAQGTAFETLGSLNTSLPRLPRPQPLGDLGYIAPTPHYAISLGSKIPEGYIAHARDSCVVFDYQWDSASAPLNWGSGGVFPEEWTSMHTRFRTGLQSLVDWYSHMDDPAHVGNGTDSADSSDIELEEDEELDIESVVIIVSHGAGCNALIGAMTHQPALMDVGLASLTMAVRKPGKEFEHSSRLLPNTDQHDPSSLLSLPDSIPIHHYYDVKLCASTEHLRTSSSAGMTRSLPPSSHTVSGRFRPRVSTMSSATPPRFPIFEENDEAEPWDFNRSSSAIVDEPARGPATINTVFNSNGARPASKTVSRAPSQRTLWSPESPEPEDDDPLFPNFDHKRRVVSPRSPPETPSVVAKDSVPAPFRSPVYAPLDRARPPSPARKEVKAKDTASPLGLGVGGLWGSSTAAAPSLKGSETSTDMLPNWSL